MICLTPATQVEIKNFAETNCFFLGPKFRTIFRNEKTFFVFALRVLPNGVYVNPLKVADWLVLEGGRGGEWGQLAKAVETIPRRPVHSPRGAFTTERAKQINFFYD